jgi:hypothetical protein
MLALSNLFSVDPNDPVMTFSLRENISNSTQIGDELTKKLSELTTSPLQIEVRS